MLMSWLLGESEAGGKEGFSFLTMIHSNQEGRLLGGWISDSRSLLRNLSPGKLAFIPRSLAALRRETIIFFFFGLEAGTTQILAKGRLLVSFDVTAVHYDARVWHIRPQYWNHLLLIDRLH